MRRRVCLFLLIASTIWPQAMRAEHLPQPEGAPILTVTGAINATNMDDKAQFDIAMLKRIEQTTIETSTIWTDGVRKFQGVSLHALLELLDSNGTTLHATAINDYSVEIPSSDAVEGGPIIAYLLDGEEMSIRDKGPLWIVYPFDSKVEYRSDVVFARSIWQLDRIDVKR